MGLVWDMWDLWRVMGLVWDRWDLWGIDGTSDIIHEIWIMYLNGKTYILIAQKCMTYDQ